MRDDHRKPWTAALIGAGFLSLLGSLPGQLPPQPAETPLQEAAVAADRTAENLRAELHLPGLSVAVARAGRLVYARGFGDADLEQGVRVTPLTKFRIGSLSKLLTSAALARLVERGTIDLDAPVRSYVRYFPAKQHAILIRHLAAHTGGIRHYGPADGLDVPRYFPTVREGLRIFEDDPLGFTPGTRYLYSSYGYNLLSAAIEEASATDFLTVVRREVTEPLAMHSTVADNRFDIIEHRTRFYHRLDEGVTVNAPEVDNSYKWASGGFLSTASDLVHLGLAHCQTGFLSAETLQAVFTPQPATEHETYSVGLGWRISQAAGRTFYHHGGAISGGRAFILVQPAEQTVVVLLANLFSGFGLREAEAFAEIFRAID